MGNSILEQEVFLFSGYKNKKWSTTKVVIGRPQKMLEQTTVEVIAINDHRKCYRGDHTTVIVIMPLFTGTASAVPFCFHNHSFQNKKRVDSWYCLL